MKKMRDLFMKDWFFFIISIAICAGVMGSVHMYMVHNTGYLNGLAGGQLIIKSWRLFYSCRLWRWFLNC